MIFQNGGVVTDQSQDFLLRAKIDQPFFLTKKIWWAWGLDIVSNFSRTDGAQWFYFHRAYVEASFYGLQVQLGYKPLNMGHISPDLSLGTFLSNQNYRTAPGVAVGVFDYISVPFTYDYLKFKGSLEHYWMQEVSHVRYYQKHRKTFYLGTQNLPINIFLGLDHVALFAGEHPHHGKLPSNFQAYKDVFLGRMQSQTTSNGNLIANEINAYGNHLYTMEWGLDFKIKDYEVLFYYQKPGDDGLGYLGYWNWVYYKFLQNEDVFCGITIKNENSPSLSFFSIEYINTLHQNGSGLNDLTVPDPSKPSEPIQPHYNLAEGKNLAQTLLSPPYIDYFAKKFGEHVRQFDEHQILKFISDEYNGGQPYGGRTSYYSNTLYSNIYFGKTMGSPLLYTKSRYERLRGGISSSYPGRMANNAVEGVSFGFKGFIYDVGYKALFTFTKNYGIIEFAYPRDTKDDQGHWAFNRSSDPNYFFSGGKQQNYFYLELNYENFSQEYWKNTSLDLAISYDFGDIYHAFGLMFGMTYRIL